MIRCKQGDVVLVAFVFSDGSGIKKRPALVISNDSYNAKREEIIIAAITSNTRRILYGDTKIVEWENAGLIKPSTVVAILQTIKKAMVQRKLGNLSLSDFTSTQKNIAKSLALD